VPDKQVSEGAGVGAEIDGANVRGAERRKGIGKRNQSVCCDTKAGPTALL